MLIRRALVNFSAILCLWPAELYAQSEALVEAYNQGQTLYEAGRYEEAIPHRRKALELSEQEFGPDHLTTATLLNNLALLYYFQGRYVEAEPLYNRSLAIKEKAFGPDHPNVATSLNNLAGLYVEQGRYADAEPLYNRSLAMTVYGDLDVSIMDEMPAGRKPIITRLFSEKRRGEMYDFATLEDGATGEVVWRMTYRQTEHAGGGQKNRLADEVIHLDAGEYVLRYQTDGSHSFGDFNTEAPHDPFSYGVTLFRR